MAERRKYKYEGNVLYLKCTKCGRWKTIENYCLHAGSPFGVRSACSSCCKKYRKANRKRILEYQREYYIENKESISERHREYNIRNKDILNEKNKVYRKEKRDKISQTKREYYKKNRDKMKKIFIEYRNRRSEELGFNRNSFHRKASQYVNKHGIKPKECPLCGCNGNIIIHHPYYSSYDCRSIVVFCCNTCHQRIHRGEIQCPSPINLLSLK